MCLILNFFKDDIMGKIKKIATFWKMWHKIKSFRSQHKNKRNILDFENTTEAELCNFILITDSVWRKCPWIVWMFHSFMLSLSIFSFYLCLCWFKSGFSWVFFLWKNPSSCCHLVLGSPMWSEVEQQWLPPTFKGLSEGAGGFQEPVLFEKVSSEAEASSSRGEAWGDVSDAPQPAGRCCDTQRPWAAAWCGPILPMFCLSCSHRAWQRGFRKGCAARWEIVPSWVLCAKSRGICRLYLR